MQGRMLPCPLPTADIVDELNLGTYNKLEYEKISIWYDRRLT